MKKILLLASALAIVGCGSLEDFCAERLCEVTTNGETTYIGDPELVAQKEAEIAQQQQQRAEIDAMWQALEADKPAGEPIRVGLMPIYTSEAEFESYRKQFAKWQEAVFANDPRIELVPYKEMKMKLELVAAPSPDDPGFRSGESSDEIPPTEAKFKEMRDFGLDVDVMVFTYLSPKTESGLVGGDGGMGVASVSRIEISSVASSIYSFNPIRAEQMGKSVGSFSIAGIDKDGNTSSGSMDTTRSIDADKEAAQAVAAAILEQIKTVVAPTLPSKAAADEVRAKIGSPEQQVLDALQGLFGG